MAKTKAEQRNQDQLAEIARLKDDYIRYFEAAPIYRMAAYSIGRDEDTLLTWRKEDPEFAERIRRAKATWALKKIQATRDTKFLLERILKEVCWPFTSSATASRHSVAQTARNHPGRSKRPAQE